MKRIIATWMCAVALGGLIGCGSAADATSGEDGSGSSSSGAGSTSATPGMANLIVPSSPIAPERAVEVVSQITRRGLPLRGGQHVGAGSAGRRRHGALHCERRRRDAGRLERLGHELGFTTGTLRLAQNP